MNVILHPRRHWSGVGASAQSGLSVGELETLRAEALRWTFVIILAGGLFVHWLAR